MKAGWQKKMLAEVCHIRPPKSEARERLAPNEMVSFVPMEDLGVDQKYLIATQSRTLASVAGSYTYFGQGDLLLAKITPCFQNGKLGIASGLTNGVGFGSSEFIVLRPMPILNNEYLYYYLSRPSFRIEGAARMGGAVGQQRVSKGFIDSYPISLPSLTEQKRIVAILDKAFNGIVTVKVDAEKNLQNARALFESRLQHIFSQRGDEWSERTLAEAADANCTLSYGIVQPGDDYPNGLPVVRPADMTKKVITLDGLKRIDPRLAKGYRRTVLFGGEVLLCVRGNTGVVAKASAELSGGNVTRGIVPIRFDRNVITPDFGFYVMGSAAVQRQIREKTYGAALMQINIQDLRKVTLPVPTLRQQEEIAAELDTLTDETQHLEGIYLRKIAALEELKKSLLHQAFTGGL